MAGQSRKSAPRRRTTKKPRGGGVFAGLLIGLVVGAVLAAGLAWYFTRSSPFQEEFDPATRVLEPIAEPIALPGKPGDRAQEKRDFDFYTILPQGTRPPSQASSDSPPPPEPSPPVTAPAQRLYLQVGAFEDPAEADNMKALLALNGVEAVAQRTRLNDGRTVHRVRVGPFARPEDMASVRSRLSSAGISGVVVQEN